MANFGFLQWMLSPKLCCSSYWHFYFYKEWYPRILCSGISSQRFWLPSFRGATRLWRFVIHLTTDQKSSRKSGRCVSTISYVSRCCSFLIKILISPQLCRVYRFAGRLVSRYKQKKRWRCGCVLLLHGRSGWWEIYRTSFQSLTIVLRCISTML